MGLGQVGENDLRELFRAVSTSWHRPLISARAPPLTSALSGLMRRMAHTDQITNAPVRRPEPTLPPAGVSFDDDRARRVDAAYREQIRQRDRHRQLLTREAGIMHGEGDPQQVVRDQSLTTNEQELDPPYPRL
jgi:hypothetical protein